MEKWSLTKKYLFPPFLTPFSTLLSLFSLLFLPPTSTPKTTTKTDNEVELSSKSTIDPIRNFVENSPRCIRPSLSCKRPTVGHCLRRQCPAVQQPQRPVLKIRSLPIPLSRLSFTNSRLCRCPRPPNRTGFSVIVAPAGNLVSAFLATNPRPNTTKSASIQPVPYFDLFPLSLRRISTILVYTLSSRLAGSLPPHRLADFFAHPFPHQHRIQLSLSVQKRSDPKKIVLNYRDCLTKAYPLSLDFLFYFLTAKLAAQPPA